MHVVVKEKTQASQVTLATPCPLGHADPRAQILVVDDENGPRQALRMLLNEDYDVHLAPDVASALDVLHAQSIQLIITDLRMPKLSGVDLLRHARERYPDVQVIILTGYGQLDTAMAAVRYGAFAYLEKPFDNVEMMRQVEGALAKQRQEHDRQVLAKLALEANRFETLGRVVAGTLHDFGTPLTVLQTQLEVLRAALDEEKLTARIDNMQSQVQYCTDMVRTTMGFLRQEGEADGLFNINSAIKSCLEVGMPYLRRQRVTVHTQLDPAVPNSRGNVVLVRQAVLNLINNAAHAMGQNTDGGELWVQSSFTEQQVCVVVRDNGPGIAPEHREQLFKTFFTTKGKEGTGLGLAVVKNVMARHGGTVRLSDPSDRGAEFVLEFPRAGN